MIFRPPPFANCHIFSDSFLPWNVEYFLHSQKTFYKAPSWIQRSSRPKLFRACGLLYAIPQFKSFAYVGPSDCNNIVFHAPCTWTYYSSHLSSRRDDLRLFCLLAQALLLLESIADLSYVI